VCQNGKAVVTVHAAVHSGSPARRPMIGRGSRHGGFTVAWIERVGGQAAPENSDAGPAEF